MNQTPLSPDTFTPLFHAVFRANHLESYTKPAIVDKFRTLTDRLLAVNAVMNLTALDTPEKIIPLHYADCALIADRIPAGATVADVGCGGGFQPSRWQSCAPTCISRQSTAPGKR